MIKSNRTEVSQVTLWFRRSGEDWRFNHLTDGLDCGERPTAKDPSFKAQKGEWSGGSWMHVHGHLDANQKLTRTCPLSSERIVG